MERQSQSSVLSRHLRILETFDALHPFRTLTEIAELTEFPLSTTHRLTAELAREGLLERMPDRSYRLGIRLWEFAARTPGALGLRELVRPWMHAVQSQVRQHTQLGVLSGQDVLFIERLSSRDAVVNATVLGGRIPLPLSSSGMVLLAHASADLVDTVIAQGWPKHTGFTLRDGDGLRKELRRIKADGYSVLDGHIYEGSRGIAVPVFGAHGEVHAALGVVVLNDDQSPDPTIQLLRRAAAEASKVLEHAYFPRGNSEFVGEAQPLLSTSPRSLEYFASRGSVDLGEADGREGEG